MANRSERVKSSLKAMGEATAQQVRDEMGEEAEEYSVREIANRLDELVLNEPDEFGKVGDVYRWVVYYRFKAATHHPDFSSIPLKRCDLDH